MADEYDIQYFDNGYEHHYHNHTHYDNNNDDNFFFVNTSLIILIFISFVTSTCCKYNIVRNGRNGVNERLIRDYTSSSSSENDQENIEKNEVKYTEDFYDKECTICLEEFVVDELLYKLVCHHYYHKDCIDDWLSKKNTCPLCRLNLL